MSQLTRTASAGSRGAPYQRISPGGGAGGYPPPRTVAAAGLDLQGLRAAQSLRQRDLQEAEREEASGVVFQSRVAIAKASAEQKGRGAVGGSPSSRPLTPRSQYFSKFSGTEGGSVSDRGSKQQEQVLREIQEADANIAALQARLETRQRELAAREGQGGVRLPSELEGAAFEGRLEWIERSIDARSGRAWYDLLVDQLTAELVERETLLIAATDEVEALEISNHQLSSRLALARGDTPPPPPNSGGRSPSRPMSPGVAAGSDIPDDLRRLLAGMPGPMSPSPPLQAFMRQLHACLTRHGFVGRDVPNTPPTRTGVTKRGGYTGGGMGRSGVTSTALRTSATTHTAPGVRSGSGTAPHPRPGHRVRTGHP
eukprot:Hpha_TRINITY_DN15105_c7_g6::TRINITY_DN15105_c7_g6_i1::g.126908::m.126908